MISNKTLELSIMILQHFHHVVMHTSLEWAQHALADDCPTQPPNASMSTNFFGVQLTIQ